MLNSNRSHYTDVNFHQMLDYKKINKYLLRRYKIKTKKIEDLFKDILYKEFLKVGRGFFGNEKSVFTLTK